ncbi:hypothetical protein BJY52DRAFT_1259206 [Lactarius psammicola]|nr:hypothetical protein BJY52DRAFT_1259206 [Lactarius psammicola]
MLLPGEWVDSSFPPGGGDAPPQPDSLNNNNLEGLKVNIVPRVYHRSENLSLEFWDDRRLAEYILAVMPLDSAPAAVDFILRDRISGSFLLNYSNQIDELVSGNKCELTRRIAKIVPFWIPRRRARFTWESYCLPELVEDLDAKFSLLNMCGYLSGNWQARPLVAGEEVEEVFDWGDENPYPSYAGIRPGGQPQLETCFPLTVALPQSSLGHDIFTSPALLQMGCLRRCATQCLNPVRSTNNDARLSGSKAPGGRSSARPEVGRRSGRTSAGVVLGCPFLCLGVGVLAPFRDLPGRLLVIRQLIEGRRPDQAEPGQSHVQ